MYRLVADSRCGITPAGEGADGRVRGGRWRSAQVDRKTDEVGFVVYGGGFGHGVGLSQTGAVGMAEKGRTYDEILKHYHRDIDLVAWY